MRRAALLLGPRRWAVVHPPPCVRCRGFSASASAASAVDSATASQRRVLMFPGQGSQRVGAGRDLLPAFPYTSAVFDEADEALGWKLSDLLWNGTATQLRETEMAQPAILTVSYAIWTVVQRELGLEDAASICRAVLGHSLGEYTALVVAGALPFRDAVQLVHTRGRLMKSCVAPDSTSMAALNPCSLPFALHLCERARAVGDCYVANVNSQWQAVITGSREGVQAAIEEGKVEWRGEKVRRAVLLDVSAPFHSPLMRPIQPDLAAVIADEAKVRLRPPSVPIVSNVSAEETSDVAVIRSNLVAHLTSPVQWLQSVLRCRALGVGEFVEMGPSAVLGPLTAAIHRHSEPPITDFTCQSLCSAEEVHSFLRHLELRARQSA